MFTGIIKEIGVVREVRKESGKVVLGVSSEKIIKELEMGSSVSINGACQTVIKMSDTIFYVEAVEETLEKTTLGKLSNGSRVNLETALKLSDGLDGHIVQGHVDGVGTIMEITEQNGSWLYSIRVHEKLAHFFVEKGSIAVDGISLTIARLNSNIVTISVIPFTMKETTLSDKKRGDEVNIEVDIIGKYVWRYTEKKGDGRKITPEWLRDIGFM
ncbi:riboflavin synthase [candidate division KSB1 bacterium]